MDGVWLTSRSSPFHPKKEALAPSEWEAPRGARRKMCCPGPEHKPLAIPTAAV